MLTIKTNIQLVCKLNLDENDFIKWFNEEIKFCMFVILK